MHKILDYHSKSHRIFATFSCLLGFQVHMVLMMKPVHCGFANLQAEKIVFCGSFADREKHSSGVVVESCNPESSPIAKQFHDMPRSSMLVYVSLDLASADSVSDDYMPYMLWQFPTNVTGWICSTLVTSSLLKVCLLWYLIFPFSSKISVADLLSGKEIMLHSIQSISNCWSSAELNATTMSKTCNHRAKFALTDTNWLCSYCFLDWGMVTGCRHRWRWQFCCCSCSCYQVIFGFLTHMWACISWSGIKMSILFQGSWIITWHWLCSMIALHFWMKWYNMISANVCVVFGDPT